MLVGCKDIVRDESVQEVKLSSLDVQGLSHVNEMLINSIRRPLELGQLVQGMNKHFYSNGAFNLIQLVLYVLQQTGPAHLFLCTYSISTDSIATLVKHREQGDILDVRFLIDNRVRTISPKPFDYLITSFPLDYRCCALHAKVALIWNRDWKVSIVGSQNATHNPKLERGIIHTEESVFRFDLNMLQNAFDRGTT